MITIRARIASRTGALTALMALAIALSASACSSGAAPRSSASAATVATQSASKQGCQQVDAVLSDGPDPGADPVGYAEAQILPLRGISTTDAALRTAIGSLARAYSDYSAADGQSKKVTATLNAAISKINSLCPSAGASL